MTLTFCLNVDTEADFYYLIPSPHFNKFDLIKWKINKLLGNLYKYAPNRQGLINLVNFFKKREIPITFSIVGHLYLKYCNGYPHFKEIKPKATWFEKDWYYWDPASNYKKYPGLYIGDFIEKEMKGKLFDLGLHGFTHEAFLFEDEKVINTNIKAAIKSANNLGINPISYSSPFNLNEDINNPNKLFNILSKNNIKVITYSGKDDGFNILRFYSCKPLIKRKNIYLIHISNYFEGNSPKKLIYRILNEIKTNFATNKIYLLCTHDFTHKNIKNINFLFTYLLKWQEMGLIKIKNMKQIIEKNDI